VEQSTPAPRGPHQGQPAYQTGAPLDTARAAVIMVHGRGASAADILSLADELSLPDFTYLAPEAAGNTWYPYPFMTAIERNEPYLSSALRVLSDLLAHLAAAGIPPERVVLLGFSQGACLSTEFAARNARRYGGVVGLSGGLIGPEGTPRDYPGSLAGTPVFLGCSDIDPHIPKTRVQHTADVLRRLGGEVTLRLYPGMGHTVNRDEIDFVRGILSTLATG
jgi:predicted esterase